MQNSMQVCSSTRTHNLAQLYFCPQIPTWHCQKESGSQVLTDMLHRIASHACKQA